MSIVPVDVQAVKPFLTGALSGMIVTSFSQPIDTLKTRIQIVAAQSSGSGARALPVVRDVLAADGFRGLYKGLSAAVTRQLFYKGASLGLFDKFKVVAARGQDGSLPFWKTSICAAAAGGLGAFASNPADKALVRMQADSLRPVAERKGYKHVGHAIASIARAEGIAGLWRGSVANFYRAVGGNFGMLAFSTQVKQTMEQKKIGSEKTRVLVSAGAGGLAMSIFSLPFDYIKTQLQTMRPDPVSGKIPYKGPLDCASKQLVAHGPRVFFTGFPVFFLRIAPTATAVLVVQDYLKMIWKRCGL